MSAAIQRRYDFPLIAAFFAIYVIWGSTFLAIRVAALAAPPWFCAGVRFFVAGSLLYGFMRFRGVEPPTGREWKSLAIVAMLMFALTYGALFWAAQFVPSGITSVLEAMTPLFTVSFEVFLFRQQAFRWKSLLALLAGISGIALMVLQGHQQPFAILPTLAILGASAAWSFGAVTTRALSLPASRPLTAGAEMLIGGAVLLVASALHGELSSWPHVGVKVVLALLYLIVPGSLIAFSSFVYLLGRLPASRVASHAFVNPVVAVFLGHVFASETFTTQTLLGAALVISSVAFTVLDPTPTVSR